MVFLAELRHPVRGESLFEAKLDKKLLDKLVQKLIEIIEESEDSIRVYPLCAACETGISILGYRGRL